MNVDCTTVGIPFNAPYTIETAATKLLPHPYLNRMCCYYNTVNIPQITYQSPHRLTIQYIFQQYLTSLCD